MSRTGSTTVTTVGTSHSHSLGALDQEVARAKAAEAALDLRLKALEPVIPPISTVTVTVTSIGALYAALTVDANEDITWAAGVYSGDVWSDSRFAGRTKPAVIHCAGVTLQGRLAFRAGAHDQTWDDLTFANLTISQTGVVVFGGYAGEPGPHHITIRKPKVLGSVRRANAGSTTEHAVYFSYATGDWGDILIEDLDVDATDPMGLASAIHGDHGYPADAPNVTARRVIARRTVFRGNGTAGASVQAPLILWQPPYHDWLFDGATITNANGNAVRFESIGASNIGFKNIVSTGSRNAGFYSSMGANPPGVVFGTGNVFG